MPKIEKVQRIVEVPEVQVVERIIEVPEVQEVVRQVPFVTSKHTRTEIREIPVPLVSFLFIFFYGCCMLAGDGPGSGNVSVTAFMPAVFNYLCLFCSFEKGIICSWP